MDDNCLGRVGWVSFYQTQMMIEIVNVEGNCLGRGEGGVLPNVDGNWDTKRMVIVLGRGGRVSFYQTQMVIGIVNVDGNCLREGGQGSILPNADGDRDSKCSESIRYQMDDNCFREGGREVFY